MMFSAVSTFASPRYHHHTDTLEALLRYTMSHVAKHVICNLSINNDDDDDDSDIASKVKINLENTVMITTIVATMLKLWLLR